MRLIAVLLFTSCLSFCGTIWGDPTVDYPPTSSTSYLLNSLGNAAYVLTDNQTLSQVSIAGMLYLEVESGDLGSGPALPIPPPVPVVVPVPVPAPVPAPVPVPVPVPVPTPEPASVYVVGAIAAMIGLRLLVR